MSQSQKIMGLLKNGVFFFLLKIILQLLFFVLFTWLLGLWVSFAL